MNIDDITVREFTVQMSGGSEFPAGFSRRSIGDT